MDLYLIDGTYELFRNYYAVPQASNDQGQEVAAVRGVLNSLLSMLERGTTHIGVATDHVVESFRNQLYPGYKTGDGVPEDLILQFPLLEEALESMGIVVWPMVEFEADDALASAAAKAEQDGRVGTIFICTPDKDLSQCVKGTKIVHMDRMRKSIRDQAAVLEKFGVAPESIPDYLALVGDTADGYPGLPGWGAKTTSQVLSVYGHLESIPDNPSLWTNAPRNASKLSAILRESWADAILYRRLATLRLDAPVFETVDELHWKGPRASFEEMCARLRGPNLLRRARALARP